MQWRGSNAFENLSKNRKIEKKKMKKFSEKTTTKGDGLFRSLWNMDLFCFRFFSCPFGSVFLCIWFWTRMTGQQMPRPHIDWHLVQNGTIFLSNFLIFSFLFFSFFLWWSSIWNILTVLCNLRFTRTPKKCGSRIVGGLAMNALYFRRADLSWQACELKSCLQ